MKFRNKGRLRWLENQTVTERIEMGGFGQYHVIICGIRISDTECQSRRRRTYIYQTPMNLN